MNGTTMTQPDSFLGTPDFPRNHLGQPQIIPAGGGKPRSYGRASSYANMLANRNGLERWMKQCVAKGVIADPSLVERAASTQDDYRDFARVVDQMFIAGGGDAAAKLGTAIHDALAQLDQGHITVDDVPAEFQQHARHWQDALALHGFEVVPEYVECHLVCDDYEVAGSADNILRRISDGALVIADKKTGKSISDRPIDYAVQMFLYAHSELYDVRTGERTPLNINKDTAYLFHIPASGTGCDVYEIHLQGTTKEAAELARSIHHIRRNFEKVTKRTPQLTPTVDPASASQARREWIKERIKSIIEHSEPAKIHLLRTWPTEVPTFKSGHQHTDEEISTLIEVLLRIEIAHDLPFGPGDPDAARMEERDLFKLKKVFPEAKPVDDSDKVDEESLTRLRDILNALPDKSKEVVKTISHEAQQANRSLSLTKNPSPRLYETAQALVSCSMFEDFDIVRAIVALVEPEAFTDATLGRIFGGLRIEQAQHLQKIAHALDSDVLKLTFNSEGTPEIHGDLQAIIAA
jgi:hypothetical protein